MFHNLHYVVEESHVEHPVCLVKNEKRNPRKIHAPHLQMGQKSARSCNHHIRAELQSALLQGECRAVSSSVDGQTAHIQEIAESLKLLVNLHGEFACRSHHDAVHRVFRKVPVGQTVEHRK